ncbi:hypothetical protein P3L51_18030 [Streptomyces sp. PSRA5]
MRDRNYLSPFFDLARETAAHAVQNGTIAWQALGRQQTAAGESRAD